MGPMYIETPYISSSVGPMYIETPYISSCVGPMYIETPYIISDVKGVNLEVDKNCEIHLKQPKGFVSAIKTVKNL